jgi:hypothetical protein
MNTYGISRIAEAIEGFLESGRFTVDGQQKTVDIRKIENTGDRIRVFLYLPASDQAETITKVELIDNKGLVIDEQTDIKEKPAKKGLLVAFDYTISEVS